MNRQIKKQLEDLYTDPNNSKCFDCDNMPAHWASVTNGIYLCMDCSGEHRGFGVGVSFIKSVTLDQWTQDQVNLMKAGGNQRLKDFLTTYEMPGDIDKKVIYCSKIMNYYRKQLKAESLGQLFMEPLPPKEEFWSPATLDDDTPNIFSSNNNSNNLFSNNNINSINNNNDLFSFNNNYLNNNNNNNDTIFGRFPKNEIIISEDQYEKARNQAENAAKFSNPIPCQPKFSTSSKSNPNDERFGSVGSDPNSSSNSGGSSWSGLWANSGYLSTVGNILGTVWGAGANVASGIYNKMNEYEVGSKLLYVGGQTVKGIAYVGGKAIETGGNIIRSETVQNIASKAGDGLWYLKDKIVGAVSSSSSSSGNNGSFISGGGDYTGTGSDDYKY